MITLHHLEKSRSFRILWALEELGLDYQIQYYHRTPSFSAPTALKKIHALGKAPILQDAQRVIAESAVILEYLQQQYAAGQFKPDATQTQDAYQYVYWMHYTESSLMPLLVFQLVLSNVPKHVPFLLRGVARKLCAGIKGGFIRPRLRDHIAFVEQYLAENDYVAGEFSFADIQLFFALEALKSRNPAKFPQIQAYVQRLQTRPAYQRAKAKEIQLA